MDAQRASVYKFVYDRGLGRVGGSAALDTIGDRYTAAAVGDTLFRDGDTGGADLVRDALTDIYNSIPRNKRKQLSLDAGFIGETGRLGPRSLDTLQKLVRAGYGLKVRNALADNRNDDETARNDYFRFKGR